ncbi:serine hydrolase [Xanthobacter sp. TB0136]|uniref:serine hydrolase n=1 Tax=Xanthobacter sp. TB0136 TaxID=3459177 RepID=UPI004039D2C7
MRSASASFSLLTKALGVALIAGFAFTSPAQAQSSKEQWKTGSSSIIVDANTGRVLQAQNADALRHPASVTKVMTLYLLFERMEAGRLSTNSRLPVSARAAAQPPSKLGVRAGSSISVDDAIQALVTRSANDVAVVIAEAIGGSEANFAAMMTRKARALGMHRTNFYNASGLPHPGQVTTARDLAILGRAIQDRFPRQYRYFATRSFNYQGRSIANHNRLLGRVEGVDGIKTGYTRASGFNLLTSVKRDGRYVIGVVLGGRTGRARDAQMAELIATHLPRATAGRRTAPRVTENPLVARSNVPVPEAVAREEATPHSVAPLPKPEYIVLAEAEPEVTGSTAERPQAMAGSTAPIAPVAVRTATIPRPAARVRESNNAAQSAVASAEQAGQGFNTPAGVLGYLGPDGQATSPVEERATAALSNNNFNARDAVQEASRFAAPAPRPAGTTRTASLEPTPAPTPARASSNNRPSSADSGWAIQIGAFNAESQARQSLSLARTTAVELLGNADPYTEKVTRGSNDLYRARFAGLDKKTAEAACRLLKRNAFACMTVRN